MTKRARAWTPTTRLQQRGPGTHVSRPMGSRGVKARPRHNRCRRTTQVLKADSLRSRPRLHGLVPSASSDRVSTPRYSASRAREAWFTCCSDAGGCPARAATRQRDPHALPRAATPQRLPKTCNAVRWPLIQSQSYVTPSPGPEGTVNVPSGPIASISSR